MICIRLDLDYVPWDSYNANLYGHGEPAMILKLLALARELGLKYHFFASVRTMRAFPTLANAILGEAHDLDWLCEKAGDEKEFAEANQLFALAGHKILGVAYLGVFLNDVGDLRFLSADVGSVTGDALFFPVSGRFDDATHAIVADSGGLRTFAASPQVLAKVDPSLSRFEKFAREHAQSVTTLREEITRERKQEEKQSE